MVLRGSKEVPAGPRREWKAQERMEGQGTPRSFSPRSRARAQEVLKAKKGHSMETGRAGEPVSHNWPSSGAKV